MLHLAAVQYVGKPQEGLPLCLRAATVSHLQGQKSTLDSETQDTIQHTISKPTSEQDLHALGTLQAGKHIALRLLWLRVATKACLPSA